MDDEKVESQEGRLYLYFIKSYISNPETQYCFISKDRVVIIFLLYQCYIICQMLKTILGLPNIYIRLISNLMFNIM